MCRELRIKVRQFAVSGTFNKHVNIAKNTFGRKPTQFFAIIFLILIKEEN